MAKFAKLFENDKGEQLLLKIKNVDDEQEEKKEEVAYGVTFTFEQEEASVDVTISPMAYEKACNLVNNFTQEEADKILVDPFEYFTGGL